MNNVYVQVFKDKHEKDIEKEKFEAENLKLRQKEVQQTVLKQIEEKRAKDKGMTNDEFEFNKDLLKEIASKRKDLRDTVRSIQNHNISQSQTNQPPAY